jgi:hypothetical protein
VEFDYAECAASQAFATFALRPIFRQVSAINISLALLYYFKKSFLSPSSWLDLQREALARLALPLAFGSLARGQALP